jgi:hypothetical protein
MICDMLRDRAIPALLPDGITAEGWSAYREEIVSLLAREVYGITPAAPDRVRARVVEDHPRYWAGNADQRRIELSFDTPRGEFTFPIDLTVPCADRPVPLVVYISFTPQGMGKYIPVEEIADKGFAMACIYYNDVAFDGEDHFEGGIAAMYPRRGDGTDWGKIGMWAFAASRVLDYALTLPEIDPARIVCVGHSRLGKTALWAAAQDTRFAGVHSNDSGCSGAALSRGTVGETVEAIVRQFPYWFCTRYHAYAGREADLPFDQHYLLAAIAPRPLYACSATEDQWADPANEFLSCVAASDAWHLLGKAGLVARADRLPLPGERFAQGDVGYHLRPGTHFLSRYDWVRLLDFFAEKL